MQRPGTILHTIVDFINTLHLGYSKFIQRHGIKLGIKENDATKRHRKLMMYAAATGVTPHTIILQTFLL